MTLVPRLIRVAAALLACWAGPALVPPATEARGDSVPEVVRVHVPEARVSTSFPPGTTLRTLAGAEFDALVARAAAGRKRAGAGLRDRPVRVDHFARWDGSMLVGRSRVTLPTPLGPARRIAVGCDPWSPAVVDPDDRSQVIRFDPTGRLILVPLADQPAGPVEIEWRQAALPNSLGRVFALRLPAADLATLTLDLPDGCVPVATAAPSGSRRDLGPDPTGTRSRWEFVGASGAFPIQVEPTSTRPPPRPAQLRVGGTTRIDLNAPTANWVADWRIESNSAAAPTTCSVDLDPGLELLDVAGPDVLSFRLAPSPATMPPPGRSRVEVTFQAPELPWNRVTPLTIRAHAMAPLAGTWPIPSARPVDAGWLGGRTEVRLDPARQVVGAIERSGRRAAARPGESIAPTTWVFDSDGRPGPVADLQLGSPRADASVAIEGTLHLGALAPRIEVRATWTIGRGRLLDPSVDFPAPWVVDRVVGGDGLPSTPWHVEAIPGGVSRVHLDGSAWAANTPGWAASIVLSATRVEPAAPALHGPLDLPRVRPTSGPVRVGDERWVARVEPGWEVEPTSSRGLVWFDPPQDSDPTSAESVARPPGRQLAWRWLDDPLAGGTITRRRVESPPLIDERLEATIAGGRLRLTWFWTIAASGRPDQVAVHLDLEPTAAPRWRVVERLGDPVLEPQSLTAEDRARLDFPMTGSAITLPLGHLPAGPVTLRGDAEVAWSGSGTIPLARSPTSTRVRRSVVVRVEDATRCRVDRVEGLTRAVRERGEPIDPKPSPEAEPTPYRVIVGDDVPGFRVASAWVGDAGGGHRGRLDVTTRGDVGRADPTGFITEAALTSGLAPGTDARHRLLLRVAPGPARTFDLELPTGARLDRVRRDGQPAVVTLDGPTLRVDLTARDPTRPTTTLTLEYRTAAEPAPGSGLIHPARFLPRVPLACLSFTWQVNTPGWCRVVGRSPDLIAADLARSALVPGESTGGRPGAPDPNGAAGSIAAMIRSDLDKALATAPPEDTTLGDWLVRLDAGRWPLLIDRIALQGVGLGPRSRVDVADPGSGSPRAALAVFRAIGLWIQPVGGVLLVTTEAERTIDPTLADLALELDPSAVAGLGLFAAAVAGSDRSDRYQAPARFRGEPTPRAWLASETPVRGLLATGWRSDRFTASTWPTAAVAIELRDDRTSWRQPGQVFAALATLVLLAGAIRVAVQRGPRRGALSRAGGLILVLTWSASARDDPADPIIAVLPYHDLAEVEARPSRVVLAAADHDRLVRWANPVEGAEPRASLVAVNHHLVRAASGRAVRVETRSTIEVIGPGAAPWSWPVGSTFDLAATVDGQPASLAISPDGRTATVGALPPGRTVVVLRRSVPLGGLDLASGREGGLIRVPVGRSASARVEVERGDWTGPITFPNLVGASWTGPEGVGGEIGPAEEIVVRWGDVAPARAARSEFRAAIRWDTHPAGDRLIARLTVAGTTPVGSLRVKLEPGLAVVAQTIPGLVGITTGAPADPPGWVAHLDPPLPPGASCELTFWRPGAMTNPTRPIPWWDLADSVITGLVGLRHPDGWTGRLVDSTGAALATATDRDFDSIWGSIAPDGFALAGVSRWEPARQLVAEVESRSVRVTVRTQVEVEAVAGSARFAADSVLTDRVGLSWAAEATLDGPARLIRVEAAGLVSWTQPAPDRVHLVFDGARSVRDRTIHLEGVVDPVVPSPTATPATTSTVVPWPRWLHTEVDPAAGLGKLVLVGGDGWEVRSGGRILPPEPSESPQPSPPDRRQTHAVRSADGAMTLTGPGLAPRVDMAVASDLRLGPDQAVWTADIVAEVNGGPVGTLYWKLPTAWADGATATKPDGTRPEIRVEARADATFWTLTFDPPIASRQRLTLRAVRPIPAGATLDYPEVVPLSAPGRGTVDRYDLAITNLAGLPLLIDGATGLTPARGLLIGSGPSGLPGGVVSRAFRVASEPWSLRLRLGSATPTPTPAPTLGSLRFRVGEFDDAWSLARLERADFQVTLNTSGQIQGRAECWTEPGAAFLAVLPPAGARLIGASVGGQPVVPVEPEEIAGKRRWMIPLGDREATHAVFAWVQPARSPRGGGEPAELTTASLPGFEQPEVPIAVEVAATPAGSDLEISGGTWTRLTPSAAALARFQRLGARLVQAAERSPDPTAAQTQALGDGLITLALASRAAGRATRINAGPPSPELAAWAVVEDQVHTAFLGAGLGATVEQARAQVGLAPLEPTFTPISLIEPIPDLYRMRPLGSVEHFEGTTHLDPSRPMTLTTRRR